MRIIVAIYSRSLQLVLKSTFTFQEHGRSITLADFFPFPVNSGVLLPG